MDFQFQVVPPCGGHPGQRVQRPSDGVVSSRAPVWGASRSSKILPTTSKFQVVPPCGGHPRSNGRTSALSMFQVVPPCGGHRAFFPTGVGGSEFQVVPPCGGHPFLWSRSLVRLPVSSRAPVWGASPPRSTRTADRWRFQVVPPCGGHPKEMDIDTAKLKFQVVPPCGGHRAGHRRGGGNDGTVSSRAPVWGASGVAEPMP